MTDKPTLAEEVDNYLLQDDKMTLAKIRAHLAIIEDKPVLPGVMVLRHEMNHLLQVIEGLIEHQKAEMAAVLTGQAFNEGLCSLDEARKKYAKRDELKAALPQDVRERMKE